MNNARDLIEVRKKFEDSCLTRVENIVNHFIPYTERVAYKIGGTTIIDINFDFMDQFVDGVIEAMENEDFLTDKIEYVKSNRKYPMTVLYLITSELDRILKKRNSEFISWLLMKLPVLEKEDDELGIAYFCPACKAFVCGERECACGQKLDYDDTEKYTGATWWR